MNQSTIKHFPKSSARMDFIDAPLKTTFDIIDRYVEYFLTKNIIDRPFSYNERATLSLLAGGIWQSASQNLVLEEYCTVKGCDEGKYYGRGDIWFLANGLNCYAEAKERKMDLKIFGKTIAMEVLDALKNEQQAACRTADYEKSEWVDSVSYDRILGIMFLRPYLSQKHMKVAPLLLKNYYTTLEAALQENGESCHIVWGKYFRQDLVEQSFFNLRDGNDVFAHTNLDILICTTFE